jgi:two-component system sensor histidine kinase UhpB
LRTLEDARHLEISISGANSTAYPPAQIRSIAAPRWFVRLVEGVPLEFHKPLNNATGDVITIRTNPGDEIAEVWQETRVFLLMLLVVLLTLNGILYLIIGRWFQPVTTILDNLGQVEHGGFSGTLPANALPELRVIDDRIKRLSAVLAASRKDNELLTSRSLLIQEEERRHLAQELHDEMGQSISAIKAIAFSIAQRSSDDSMSREGATRIGSISNHVRDHIRSMMHRLRPVVLDELGLIPALEHMVDEWNRNHSNSFCSLRASGDGSRLSSEQQIHLYRIVQEALTNAAAHSGAESVEVSVECSDPVRLQVRDTGKGFLAAAITPGMGLSGMQERVKALRGEWALDTQPEAGVTIRVVFPLSPSLN